MPSRRSSSGARWSVPIGGRTTGIAPAASSVRRYVIPSAISGCAGSPWRRVVASRDWAAVSEVVTPMRGRMPRSSAGLRHSAPTVGPSFHNSDSPDGRVSKLPGAMSSQYIYTMYKLSRTHPPDKTVLKDINLSFFPGAKIGVLGLNGSGKSTLLRIMAGIDKDYRGEAQLAPGATVGLLSQEPELDETKDVRGNVEDGVRAPARPAGPLQRAVHELLRRDRGRVRPPAGPDRRRRRLGARPDARPGDGRAALSARRGGRDLA